MSGPAPLFDRALGLARAARRRKAEPNILTATIAEELTERLTFVNRRFDLACLFAAEPHAIAARAEARWLSAGLPVRG
jgi:hypothetical protein